MSELEKQDFLTLYKDHLDLKKAMRSLERDVRFFKVMSVETFVLTVAAVLGLVLHCVIK